MMKHKKKSILPATVLLLCLLLSACGSSYRDGTYNAQAADFAGSGWKEILEITVEDGKVTHINWDAIYKDESIPIRKKQYSKSGLYGMLAGGASEEWYDQALVAEKFVLENGIDALNMDDSGHSDAVSGCTISVEAFDALMRDCLNQAKK